MDEKESSSSGGLAPSGGHTVEIAFDGPFGLTRAESFHPAILFSDIGLPALSGDEVARALRKTSFAKKVPIVALTGYANSAHRNAMPVDIRILQTMISTLPS